MNWLQEPYVPGNFKKWAQRDPPLHYCEFWEDATSTIQTRVGILTSVNVEEWLDLLGDYTIDTGNSRVGSGRMILRLIACDFAHHQFTIGCGHTTFQKICKAFRLHETSEEAIINNNGAYGRYYTRKPGSRELDSLALVLKVANCLNIGFDALSMSYDFKSRETRAFVHGLKDDEIHRLFRSLQAQKEKSLHQQPLLLPTLIFQSHRAKTEAHRAAMDDSIHRTEVQVGYAIPGILQEKPLRYFRDLSLQAGGIEFDSITRRLHTCSTELGTITNVGSFGKELGAFLHKTAKELDDLLGNSDDYDCLRHSESLLHKIEFSTNLYSTIVSQVAALKERVQNHINLTFTLIAQDENRISRSVAEETAMIAVATKRDSVAMKTIAALSIIFLPPTFVATFFSMTMFDWKPEQGNPPIASKYMWIYWAVAIPLTAIVLFTWRVWLNMEDKRYQNDLLKANLKKSDSSSSTSTNFPLDDVAAAESLYSHFQEQQVSQTRSRSSFYNNDVEDMV